MFHFFLNRTNHLWFLWIIDGVFILHLEQLFMIPWSEVKVAQSCPTLWDPMDYSPWNSPGQNTGVGSHSLLQGIFPTQGSNPGLSNCRQILYQLSHKGSPRIPECVALSPEEIPDPGIELGSPALQEDSLPTDLWGKPYQNKYLATICSTSKWEEVKGTKRREKWLQEDIIQLSWLSQECPSKTASLWCVPTDNCRYISSYSCSSANKKHTYAQWLIWTWSFN